MCGLFNSRGEAIRGGAGLNGKLRGIVHRAGRVREFEGDGGAGRKIHEPCVRPFNRLFGKLLQRGGRDFASRQNREEERSGSTGVSQRDGLAFH